MPFVALPVSEEAEEAETFFLEAVEGCGGRDEGGDTEANGASGSMASAVGSSVTSLARIMLSKCCLANCSMSMGGRLVKEILDEFVSSSSSSSSSISSSESASEFMTKGGGEADGVGDLVDKSNGTLSS